ncbi:MAG: 3',5'-cyclic-nucleotide phosphodiesterase [Campylobacterales bacterium]|nr:3',5'-cyclic-nucleotide phosphodiesterase [Campylobacterales bacterium]
MIHVLGAQGSVSPEGRSSSFLLSPTLAIDAGNLLSPLGASCVALNNIFLTHSHFDHIADLPFLLSSYFELRTQTLRVHALPETISALQKHIFNDLIWPDFTKINLFSGVPALAYVPLAYGERVAIGGVELTPVRARHLVPTCGYLIGMQGRYALLSGDTYLNPDLIDLLNTDTRIGTLIIDVSFVSSEAQLALESMHLTPQLLRTMLEPLRRDDLLIYTYHQKPEHHRLIDEELRALGFFQNGGRQLGDGEHFSF